MLDDLGYFNRPEAGFPLHPGIAETPSFLAGQWRLAVPSAVVKLEVSSFQDGRYVTLALPSSFLTQRL